MPTPRPTRLDHSLHTLADPTRRAVLERLTKSEARATELAEPFAISLNSVSKHIRLLERAKLVTRRRAGREHRLSFNPAPLNEAAAWIEKTLAFWSNRLDVLDAMLRSEIRKERSSSQKKGKSR
jgi:DNA-binding transcriptional ArsR family regulator